MTKDPKPGVSPMILGGVFLTSLSVLALEITFTRILSVLLSYHYVFVAISVALLGLGGGGIYAHFRPKVEAGPVAFGSLARFAGLFALSAVLSLIAVTKVPYIDNIVFYSFMMLLPFFFAGVVLSRAFQLAPSQSWKVYGADLLGAAAGSLFVILLLDRFGAINGGFLVGLVGGGASLLFAIKGGKRMHWLSVISVSAATALFLISVVFPDLVDMPIGRNQAKELSNFLDNGGSVRGRITESRWSSFGRTDLVQVEDSPDVMALFVDGTAGTTMYRFTGDIKNPGRVVEDLRTSFPGYFPLQLLGDGERDNALIIGPGGGRDVLLALMAGVRQITAVEVNQDLVDMVKRYSSYNGGIYSNLANVNVVVAEGRNFLRRQNGQFDIIMLSLPVTRTSRSPEGFALTENYLFTKESIGDYLDHLTNEGRLIVVAHGDLEVMRLLSVSMAALEERGIPGTAAMDYIYTVGSHTNPVFVLSKTATKPDESYLLHKALHLSPYAAAGSYFPYVRPSNNPAHLGQNRFDECQMLDPYLNAIANGSTTIGKLSQAAREGGYDIGVVTDNRPFFYNFERGTPNPLPLVLWLALAFAGITVLVPYIHWNQRRRTDTHEENNRGTAFSNVARAILLFSMSGLGFMLVEVSLIQRFTLFLGEPILSVTVLLFSILIGAGVGGLSTGRLSSRSISRSIGVISLGIAVLVAAYAFLAPLVFSYLLGQPLPVRALVSSGLLMPLGFLLGFPFPLGIRLLKERKLEHHIPWMWGINGAASVVGSVGAIVVAMSLGLTQALLLGATCYFAVHLGFVNKVERGKETS